MRLSTLLFQLIALVHQRIVSSSGFVPSSSPSMLCVTHTRCLKRFGTQRRNRNDWNGRSSGFCRRWNWTSFYTSKATSSMSLNPGHFPDLRTAATVVLSGIVGFALAGSLRRLLWPGSSPDPDFSEPLPTGSFGCPFIGCNYKLATPNFGPGAFFKRTSTRLGHPRIWKFFIGGKTQRPAAVVTGYANSKAVLEQEFDAIEGNEVPFSSVIVGQDSLRVCKDRKEHSFLRRLVGAATNPRSVRKAIPALQEVATSGVEKLLSHCQAPNRTIDMEQVFKDYAMDVALGQIIGLKVKTSDALEFHRRVNDWVDGIHSKEGDREKALKARSYLVSKIVLKIEQLEKEGPDGSTVSGMLFATIGETADDDTKLQRLTREQVIDNTLLLILAGSETSASTLTVALLLLGLHPEAWTKVVKEQQQLRSNYGDVLSKRQLDYYVPYLDSVVKEALRLRPVTGGSMRGVKKTIVVDGRQIPKGWAILYDRYLSHELDPVTKKEDGSHMDITKGFIPERWLSEATRPKNEFIPFGVGPRYCLGADFSIAEMKTFLAILARQMDSFTLVSPSSANFEWRKRSLIPVPKDGVAIVPSFIDIQGDN